ncbi:MAG: hypothetical protein AAF675_05840, partial [Pseudomonadota bacterium]
SFTPVAGGVGTYGVTSSTFQTISAPSAVILDTAGISGSSAVGDLILSVSVSSVNEFVGFDNISTEVPVPAALPLLLGGLGALLVASRRRSAKTEV